MPRTSSHLFLALLLAGAACSATDRGSVALTNLCGPPTPQSGACTYTSTCDPQWAGGSLQVDLVSTGGTLEFPIEFTNDRTDNSDGTLRTNTNVALIEWFEARYHATGLSIEDAHWDQTFKVSTSSTNVGVVTLIPASTGQALAAALPAGPTSVLIEVRGHGHYLDGTSFTTPWFNVPVEVTKQGLVYVCADPTKKAYACPQNGQSAAVTCQ